jgi:hypothetical protein
MVPAERSSSGRIPNGKYVKGKRYSQSDAPCFVFTSIFLQKLALYACKSLDQSTFFSEKTTYTVFT